LVVVLELGGQKVGIEEVMEEGRVVLVLVMDGE